MKLVRYGEAGAEKPGCIGPEGEIRDLSGHVADIAGDTLDPGRLAELARIPLDKLPRVDGAVRVGPCVGGVGKLIGISGTYPAHSAEYKSETPDRPTIFLKATTSINGPYDQIVFPPRATQMDWEIELAVVMGRSGKYVSQQDAFDYVAGYCVCNDVTERLFCVEGRGQWTKGKSSDTFTPLGPWLVTKDEVPDPQSLNMWLEVNGARMQDSNTREMAFSVAEIISYVSEFMSFRPGDVILTGTPSGTAYGRGPQYYLKAADVLHLGIDHLGSQKMSTTTFGG